MVTDPMKKMKAGLKEKVNRMLYFLWIFRQDLKTGDI